MFYHATTRLLGNKSEITFAWKCWKITFILCKRVSSLYNLYNTTCNIGAVLRGTSAHYHQVSEQVLTMNSRFKGGTYYKRHTWYGAYSLKTTLWVHIKLIKPHAHKCSLCKGCYPSQRMQPYAKASAQATFNFIDYAVVIPNLNFSSNINRIKK